MRYLVLLPRSCAGCGKTVVIVHMSLGIVDLKGDCCRDLSRKITKNVCAVSFRLLLFLG